MPRKKYSLKIDAESKRQIDQRLPGNIRQRVKHVIAGLLAEPRPLHAKQLLDEDGTPTSIYRVRLDDWRVVYRPLDEQELIEIVKVGRKHGPEFYAAILN
jgi:mRNA-degrading endonuclease RelE of RelBE toxin-antitoxin system